MLVPGDGRTEVGNDVGRSDGAERDMSCRHGPGTAVGRCRVVHHNAIRRGIVRGAEYDNAPGRGGAVRERAGRVGGTCRHAMRRAIRSRNGRGWRAIERGNDVAYSGSMNPEGLCSARFFSRRRA